MSIEIDSEELKTRVHSVAYDGITAGQMVDGYRKWSSSYEKDVLSGDYMGHILTAKYTCDSFKPEDRKNVRVLDVGAGTGLVGIELKKAGFVHVDGLDPSAGMLEKAKERKLYENYLVEYITDKELNIPSGTYDALTGSGIYVEAGHVPVNALKEMIRLVKPGGYIILVNRLMLTENNAPYKDLEPMMDKLEAEGKWKKVNRDIGPNMYLDRKAVTWRYQVL